MTTHLTKIIYLKLKTSPWRWPDCWPKFVGENIINKVCHKFGVHMLAVCVFCEPN